MSNLLRLEESSSSVLTLPPDDSLRVFLSASDQERLHEALKGLPPSPHDAEQQQQERGAPSSPEPSPAASAALSSSGPLAKPSPLMKKTSPRPSSSAGASTSDQNADRIKSLVQRFLKTPKTAAARPADAPLSSSAALPLQATEEAALSSSAAEATVPKALTSRARAMPDPIDEQPEDLDREAPASSSRQGSGFGPTSSTEPSAETVSKKRTRRRLSPSSPLEEEPLESSRAARSGSRAASGVRGTKGASSSGKGAQQQQREDSVEDVLARYGLPAEVSAAVAAAVAAKQLPSRPSSLDALLSRLLLPGSGLKPELVHAVLKRSPAALKQTGDRLKSKLRQAGSAIVSLTPWTLCCSSSISL